MDQISTLDDQAPIISIIIPTYNRASLIRETLDSIKAQTSPHWECIVVDDGSSDNTESVVAGYSAGDSRFSFYKRDREPKGAPTCRNIGLQHAKGEWVIFLDSDDLLTQNRIQNSIQLISENPSAEVFVFRLKHFGIEDSKVKSEIHPDLVKDDLKLFLDGKCSWVTASPTWKKIWVKQIGGWLEGLEKWQDWEFHVRALLHRPRLYKINEVGYLQRISSSYNRISTNNTEYYFYKKFALCILFLIQIGIEQKIDKLHLKNLYRNFFVRLRQISILGQTRQSMDLLKSAKKMHLVSSYWMAWSSLDIIKTKACMRISRLFSIWAKEPLFGFTKCSKS